MVTSTHNFKNAVEVNDPIYNVEMETIELGWIPLTVNQSNINTSLSYMVEVSQWLIDNPNLITMKPDTVKLEEAKQLKYPEIYAHADSLIQAQENTFFDKGINSGRNKDRLLKQQNKRNNKKIKGQNLNAKEQAADDRYDSFLDWADLVYDEADLAEDAVEAMSDIEAVKGYDVVNTPNWPIWS